MRIKDLFSPFVKEKKIPILRIKENTELLKDKIVLITGGTSGIGYAIAEVMLRSGAKVIVASSNAGKVEKAVSNISSDYCKGMVFNINNISEMESKIKEACSFFPENRIDILVNSAGIHHHSGFLEISESEYDNVMDINLKGAFFFTQKICNYMIKNGIHGHILMVSSSSALRPGTSPYHLSKWAIKGFTRGLAKQMLPHNIIVNAIAPGQTATPMLGVDENEDVNCAYAMLGRYILPSEIASWAVLLVSDLGETLAGETIYATGGSGLLSLEK